MSFPVATKAEDRKQDTAALSKANSSGVCTRLAISRWQVTLAASRSSTRMSSADTVPAVIMPPPLMVLALMP